MSLASDFRYDWLIKARAGKGHRDVGPNREPSRTPVNIRTHPMETDVVLDRPGFFQRHGLTYSDRETAAQRGARLSREEALPYPHKAEELPTGAQGRKETVDDGRAIFEPTEANRDWLAEHLRQGHRMSEEAVEGVRTSEAGEKIRAPGRAGSARRRARTYEELEGRHRRQHEQNPDAFDHHHDESLKPSEGSTRAAEEDAIREHRKNNWAKWDAEHAAERKARRIARIAERAKEAAETGGGEKKLKPLTERAKQIRREMQERPGVPPRRPIGGKLKRPLKTMPPPKAEIKTREQEAEEEQRKLDEWWRTHPPQQELKPLKQQPVPPPEPPPPPKRGRSKKAEPDGTSMHIAVPLRDVSVAYPPLNRKLRRVHRKRRIILSKDAVYWNPLLHPKGYHGRFTNAARTSGVWTPRFPPKLEEPATLGVHDHLHNIWLTRSAEIQPQIDWIKYHQDVDEHEKMMRIAGVVSIMALALSALFATGGLLGVPMLAAPFVPEIPEFAIAALAVIGSQLERIPGAEKFMLAHHLSVHMAFKTPQLPRATPRPESFPPRKLPKMGGQAPRNYYMSGKSNWMSQEVFGQAVSKIADTFIKAGMSHDFAYRLAQKMMADGQDMLDDEMGRQTGISKRASAHLPHKLISAHLAGRHSDHPHEGCALCAKERGIRLHGPRGRPRADRKKHSAMHQGVRSENNWREWDETHKSFRWDLVEKAGLCTGPGPCDTTPLGHGGKNWVTRVGGLPLKVRAVAHALMRERGMDESHAIAVAVSANKRWIGAKKTKAKTKAVSAATVAEWERKKAESHVKKNWEEWDAEHEAKLGVGTEGKHQGKLICRVCGSRVAKKGDKYVHMRGTGLDADEDVRRVEPNPSRKRPGDIGGVHDIRKEWELRGEVSKYDDPQKNFFGWAYVTHDEEGNLNVDKSGEFVVDPSEIEKAAYDFALESRTGDVFHDMGQHSTMIESMVFTPEKQEALGIPVGAVPTGWWVGFHTDSDDLYSKVKDGEWMFSIHGSSIKTPVNA